MTARMESPGLRCEADFPTRIQQPAAEIDVLKPHRVELLIPPAGPLPRLAAKREEGSGGLFYLLRLMQVEVEAAIVDVGRV